MLESSSSLCAHCVYCIMKHLLVLGLKLAGTPSADEAPTTHTRHAVVAACYGHECFAVGGCMGSAHRIQDGRLPARTSPSGGTAQAEDGAAAAGASRSGMRHDRRKGTSGILGSLDFPVEHPSCRASRSRLACCHHRAKLWSLPVPPGSRDPIEATRMSSLFFDQ